MTASDWGKINNRLEREDQGTRELILKNHTASRALRILFRAGADKEKVLRLLSFCVHDVNWWQKPMRRKKRELESIANQLETVANHVERTALDPLSQRAMWTFLLQLENWKNARDSKDESATFLFNLMRLYANGCRNRAKAFGNLLRHYPRRQKRQMIDCLLIEIWLRTGKHFDKEVASLLTIAFDAVGSARHFTEEQVKKHRQRHIGPRIRFYERSQDASTSRLAVTEAAPERAESGNPPQRRMTLGQRIAKGW
jgi:hypothetical protein